MVRYIESKRDKKDNANGRSSENWTKRKTVYVYPSKKCVFLVLDDPKEGKYSYGVRIQPIYGGYYSSKEKKWYRSYELRDYNVVLNVDREMADSIKKGILVVRGFQEEDILLWPEEAREDAQETE
ncbi:MULTISPECIES: hypothetical protein [Metallosphaera]|uniref:hypothetical protein n=1 Tax=Metallosphaera TaxID=41980 RepID=UPI001F06543F|nr:hypothetical protein [Metallosphaera sedula]MCH1771779.1 hypothetical protein [Metallosphaera sedula]MCP6729105.1 hypothetical protein [Metallosphaera sedula]MCP6729108.1 hypothetical protein [Metallosphaera sedula]